MIKKLFLVLVFVTATGLSVWRLNEGPDSSSPLLLYGNVDIREVEVAFRQSGRLMRLELEEGQAVTPGMVVAELDDQPFRDTLSRAQAELSEATAALEKQVHGSRPQEIARAEAGVRQAEAALAFAASEFDRQKFSAPAGASTRQALDQARASRAQAEAQLEAARQELSLAREGSRKEDIAAARARVAGAQAILDQAKTALADTLLTAPSAGIILARLQEPGSMVGPTTPVYSMSLRNPIYLRAYVSEPQLARVVPGTQVEITTDSSPRTYHGRVGFVSPRAEFTPKSVETADLRTDLVYRLRITVEDADDGLRQGMPVSIRLDAATASQ